MSITGAFSKLFRRLSQDGAEIPSAEYMRNAFSDCADFVERPVVTGGGEKVTLCFIDGLVSGEAVAREVLMTLTDKTRLSGLTARETIDRMLEGAVCSGAAKLQMTAQGVSEDLLSGRCAVIFDGEGAAVTFDVRSHEKRSIDQPKEEKVVKGSKDAFIEPLRSNTALVRRRIVNENLRIREIEVGTRAKSRIAVIYIEGSTNKEITDEVLRRVSAIDAEGIITAAMVEENITDNPRTPFPQLMTTERPDRFCLNILEGRVGIIADGLPIGFLAPGTFAQFFKVPEDLASHYTVGTVLTALRYIAMVISLVLPSFFTAVAMYHQEMIPTKLLQSIIDAKQSVPFPAALEVLMMLIAFELLQEAGLRLPNQVGQTVSIIGALIVGQSAVEAKIVSPVVVIVVALAGISGYTVPDQDMASALRICRFLLVLAAIVAGMFGVMAGCMLILYHLCTLESFGVAYMTPFTGASAREALRAVSRRPARKRSMKEPALRTQEDGK